MKTYQVQIDQVFILIGLESTKGVITENFMPIIDRLIKIPDLFEEK